MTTRSNIFVRCGMALCVFAIYGMVSSASARPRGQQAVRSRANASVRQTSTYSGANVTAAQRSAAVSTMPVSQDARAAARDVAVIAPVYNEDVRDARNDLRDDLGDADDRRDVAEARVDFRKDVHDEVHDDHHVSVHRRVAYLPAGYSSRYVNGHHYYYHHGVYYQQDGSDYVVVDTPAEANVLEVLPDDFQEVVINDLVYFTNGTLYYMQVYQNNTVVYVKVATP